LNPAEEKQARQSFIEKEPYIEFGERLRYAENSVKIKLPTVGDALQPATIRGTLGFVVSENWTGRYKVEWITKPEYGSIPILATAEAKAAYEAKLFEVLLEIKDEDIKAGEITRRIIYNFPPNFVREDKISLNGDHAEAKFKLVPITLPENGASE